MNAYWPIYKKLEKETLELADSIYFSDDQVSVYSINISELIIRCSVEIESLSKELYERNGGVIPNDRDLYFDTDCLQFLKDKLQISLIPFVAKRSYRSSEICRCKAPIVGRVCMDQMMVDVTDIPDVEYESEVILIGKSGDEVITADDLANLIGTIGYEIVCGISKRVDRFYVE